MQLIAERFDLRTGKCLVPGILAGQAPKVRVVEPAPLAVGPAVQARSRQPLPCFAVNLKERAGIPAEHLVDAPVGEWEGEDESDLSDWEVYFDQFSSPG
jgi:hypothetical protein